VRGRFYRRQRLVLQVASTSPRLSSYRDVSQALCVSFRFLVAADGASSIVQPPTPRALQPLFGTKMLFASDTQIIRRPLRWQQRVVAVVRDALPSVYFCNILRRYIIDAVAASPEAEATLLHSWPNFNFCCGHDTVFVHARTPSSPAHHRWEFLLPPGSAAPCSSSLLRTVGVQPSLVRILREVYDTPSCQCSALARRLHFIILHTFTRLLQVPYTFHSRVSSHWTFADRVALVGDAAHCMPPFRAQGLASGLRDASNMCWKIASVLSARAHARLLDTYQLERLPHVQAAIAAAEGMGSMICLRRPKIVWRLKNRAFALVNSMGLFRLLFRFFTPSLCIPRGLLSRRSFGAAAAAVGAPVPNACTTALCGAPHLCFDEQFWSVRGGKLRWCLVVAHDGGEDEQAWQMGFNAAKTLRAELDAVEAVRCASGSAMGLWLRSVGGRAALVR
jgi:hypothetical protein